MGEARRRKPVEVKGDDVVIGSGTAAYLLEKSVDRMFLFGPVVRWPRDEPSARQWGFIVVGCDRTGETWHDRLFAGTEDDAVVLRADVMAALVASLPIIADINDQLEMAIAAKAAWPRAKINRIPGASIDGDP
jgi:hypothetical protein